MAQLNFNGGNGFNASQVQPQTAFDNLPVGWYVAKIVESEMKPASKPGASYLELVHEIIAPQDYAGRKLWNRLNLVNPNQQAVDIAWQTMSAICHATNVIQAQDTQQLHNIPLEVKVGMSKVTEQYPEPRNEIKGYRAVTGAGAGAGAGAGTQNPAMQNPAMQQQQQQQAPQQWQQPAQQQQPAVQQQQQQWQQPAEQQPQQQAQQQQQQWQQQPVEQQPAQQQQQPAGQETPSWANNNVEAQQPVQQQQQQQYNEPAPQDINVVNQPNANPTAASNAEANLPPWAQGQQ